MSRLGQPTPVAGIDIRVFALVELVELLELLKLNGPGERTPYEGRSQGLDDLGLGVCYALRRARSSEAT